MPPRFIMGKPKAGPSTGSAARIAPKVVPPITNEEDRRISEYSSLEDVCPVCKTDRYLQPKLRLMVSFCYHKMCESCMDRIFSLGPEPCPVCHVIVRKAQFRPQIFENLAVQKEVAIRKRTSKIFNKRREDFVDLKSYNDYLETFEALTFDLINDKNVESANQRMKEYEMKHREDIEANLSRSEREAQMVRMRDEEEQRVKEETAQRYAEIDEEERIAKEEERAAVLQGLESSSASTAAIISAAKKSALKRSTARTNDALVPSFSSLHFFAGLADKDAPPEEPEDLLAELGRYDGYEARYDLRGRHEGYGRLGEGALGSDEGGYVVEEVWEKAVRSSVAALFLRPVQVGDSDVIMHGT
ncbi:hypothetical protein RQP46_009222 [Phenoliferia psychrophenolica]